MDATTVLQIIIIILRTIKRKKLEAICMRRALSQRSLVLCLHRCRCRHGRRNLGKRLVAFVRVEGDSDALVYKPGHHARAGEERIMHGIRGDVGVSVLEFDGYDDEVVDMVEIITDKGLCDCAVHVV